MTAAVAMVSGALRSAIELAQAGDLFGAGRAYATADEWFAAIPPGDVRSRAYTLMGMVHDYVDSLQLVRDGGGT